MKNKILHEIGLNLYYGFREIGRKIKAWLIKKGLLAPLCSCGNKCDYMQVGYKGDWRWWCERCQKGYYQNFPF